MYIRRDKDSTLDGKLIAKIAEYHQKYGKVVRKLVVEPIELSSSEVREKLLHGEDISGLVPTAVEKYIADKHLYV